MGADSSKQEAKELASLLAAHTVTGDPRADAAKARALDKVVQSRHHWSPYEACDVLYARVRQLNPRSHEYACHYAETTHRAAELADEAAPGQTTPLWARAEHLWAETIRLGDPDYSRHVHKMWAAAVLAQGAHRRAEEQAILQRMEQIPRPPGEDREAGTKAFRDGEYATAIELYRTAHEKDHNNEDFMEIAEYLLGWKSLTSDEAIEACRIALEKNGRTAPKREYDSAGERKDQERRDRLASYIATAPHYRKALRLEKEGKLRDAAEAADRAVRACRDYTTRDLQSRILLKAGRWREAEHAIEDEHHTRAAYPIHEPRLAYAYCQQQKFKLALGRLDRLASDGLSEERLAECRSRQAKYRKQQEQAHKQARAALEDKAIDGSELQRLARFFYFECEYALSIAALRRALKTDPQNADYHGDLADALWASKARDEANESYKTALKLDEKNPQALVWHSRKGIYAGSTEDWRDAIKWDPFYAPNFGQIGLDYNIKATYDGALLFWQAKDALVTALELDDQHPDAKEWKAKLERMDRVAAQQLEERRLRASGIDKQKDRIMSHWYYTNRAYNVVGSTNQYTLPISYQTGLINGMGC